MHADLHCGRNGRDRDRLRIADVLNAAAQSADRPPGSAQSGIAMIRKSGSPPHSIAANPDRRHIQRLQIMVVPDCGPRLGCAELMRARR